MNENKHTPGPWTCNQAVFLANDPEWKEDLPPNSVAYIVTTAATHHASKANCDLIAAAPETADERDRLKALNAEMLEALKHLLHRYRYFDTDAGDAAIKQALTVIAKAEGREGE